MRNLGQVKSNPNKIDKRLKKLKGLLQINKLYIRNIYREGKGQNNGLVGESDELLKNTRYLSYPFFKCRNISDRKLVFIRKGKTILVPFMYCFCNCHEHCDNGYLLRLNEYSEIYTLYIELHRT